MWPGPAWFDRFVLLPSVRLQKILVVVINARSHRMHIASRHLVINPHQRQNIRPQQAASNLKAATKKIRRDSHNKNEINSVCTLPSQRLLHITMSSTTTNTSTSTSQDNNNSSNSNSNNNAMIIKAGILVVGLGGNNGVTLLAGHIANRRKLSWESGGCPGKGRVAAPNWGGCITQLEPKGDHGGVGFKGVYDDDNNLADAGNCAVGGWDIRPTKLGDALYQARILDYDLVRQVREEMNDVPIMKGIYRADFVGESQHASATHIVDDTTSTTSSSTSTTLWDQVQHLRKDIRNFITNHNINGHTTVIWSASVERPADVDHLKTPQELLEELQQSTHKNQTDISPSIIYATAAALEGCSFVNGGSQNTVIPALVQLFDYNYRKVMSMPIMPQQAHSSNNDNSNNDDHMMPPISTQPAYLLGTDFKAGQTKFKTAAVEYLRALGLTPRVIASSNHLGNNDMLNLTSQTTLKAKMRVKHSIFEPWKEDQLDHQVRVMYTPFMGDDKRDIVEYTSTAFLHQEHTMLTYTRCMDSILCVPLMIDAA